MFLSHIAVVENASSAEFPDNLRIVPIQEAFRTLLRRCASQQAPAVGTCRAAHEFLQALPRYPLVIHFRWLHRVERRGVRVSPTASVVRLTRPEADE